MEEHPAFLAFVRSLVVRDPVALGGTVAYPLAATVPAPPPAYSVLEDAMRRKVATLSELPAAVVGEVLVRNAADTPVLIVEGESVVGALKDRVLNLSVLVEAGASAEVPVSGVEHGRWCRGPGGGTFRPSACFSPSSLRRAKTHSVIESLVAGRGPSSDQNDVYEEVARCQDHLGAHSPTGAMRCITERLGETIADSLSAYAPRDDEVGAVVLDSAGLSLDAFGHPQVWARLHRKVLSGSVISALGASEEPRPAPTSSIEPFVHSLAAQPVQAFEAPGAGDHLVIHGGAIEGLALLHEGGLLHAFAYSAQ